MMDDVAKLIEQLCSAEESARRSAAMALYQMGAKLGRAAISPWCEDADFARLLSGPPTVGLAVQPKVFDLLWAAVGSPRLADVPADQDAQEFEVRVDEVRLDILTTRGAPGAIARFLEKFGEGIQQVEFPVTGVDRATVLLRERQGVQPIYPEPRPGADGTRVNFFLAATPQGKKVLIELVEAPR